MIEAVNSVLANAPFTKVVAEQQSVAQSFAANPDRVQVAPTQAPYISLYIKVDTNFDKAILQIRDSDTGDVVRQIPTESQLEAYRRAQTSNAVRSARADEPVIVEPSQTESSDAPVAKTTSAPTPAPVSAPAPSTPDAPVQSTSAPAPSPQPTSVDTTA